MSQTYTGTAAYTNSITIPDDGDPAAAASVNPASKSEADMNMFLLQSIGLQPESSSDIVISSTDRSTINIGAISSFIVNENGLYKAIGTNGVVTIGIGQVEGGPAQFDPSTWYYIYAFSTLGILTFIIRKVRPDVWRMFALGSDTQRYVGCFRTDSGTPPEILPFVASRGKYSYLDELSAGGGNAIAETLIATNGYIPPTSRCGVFGWKYANAGLASTFNLVPVAGLPGYVFIARQLIDDSGAVELPVDGNQQLRYFVGSADVVLSVYVHGFYE
jgi:hypothetical protein